MKKPIEKEIRKKKLPSQLFYQQMFFVVMMVIIFSLAKTAQAVDWYCSPSGSGTDCTAGQPCTLDTAISSAYPGDTVYLTAGVYSGSGANITTVRSGSDEDHRITIKSVDPPLSAKLDLNGVTGIYGGIYVIHSYITIDGIEIMNVPEANGIRIEGDANGTVSDQDYGNDGLAFGQHYHANGAEHVVVRNCLIHDIALDCLKSSRADFSLYENNEIYGCGVNGNGIDFVGSYDSVARGNYLHDISTIAAFSKGGSENIVWENNRFDGLVDAFACLTIGQDTEYYNTRYTPSQVSTDLHDNILTWSINNNVSTRFIQGAWESVDGRTFTDNEADFSDANDSIYAGMKLTRINVDGWQVADCTIASWTQNSITCGDDMALLVSGQTANFSPGDSYRILDPTSNRGSYVAQTMAECRNCVARNNLFVGCAPALELENAYNPLVIHNTMINCGSTQGIIKLRNDESYYHVTTGARLYNNLAYNDISHPVSSTHGWLLDKNVGAIYPNNLTGYVSNYNLIHDAASAGFPSLGHTPLGQEAQSLEENPSLDGNFRPDDESDPPIDSGYDLLANGIIGSVINDHDGVARPQLVGYDIGAYEFDPAAGDEIAPTAPVGLVVE